MLTLKYRRKLRLKKLLIFILIVVAVLLVHYLFTKSSIKGNIIVTSLTYYNSSKLYRPNTAVLLFRANYDLSQKPFLKCISRNAKGDTIESITSPRSAYVMVMPCQMHTFTAACKTVSNPIKMFITSIDSSNTQIAEVPIRYAIREKIPIVGCLNAMFFAEKWQVIALSIEWYAYFGVNRQVYYMISALRGIYDMLKEYEKENTIKIEYFTVPHIPDVNSRLQLDYHDQAGAFNDCYLNYREAADFIIVHDSDDLIYLNGDKFYPNFIQTWMNQPLTAFIHFRSTFAEVFANKTLNNFDIESTMNTLNLLPMYDRGKSVYNTSLVETVWSHHATYYDAKLSPKIVKDTEGMQIHARYFYDANETSLKNEITISKSLLSDIRVINQRFIRKKQSLSSIPSIATMESSNRYYQAIDDCVQSIAGDNAPVIGCRTHYACKIPRFYNLQCIEARQTYTKYPLTKTLNIYVAQAPSKPILNINGCSL